ncbi:MAG TPA: hypothetical protein VMH61_02330 [Candidatus Acidoferrales bacterium]|nr:hypothetical protein [Candidatus Acidoferrales bacterium]
MSVRTIGIVLVVVAAILGVVVWQSQMQRPTPPESTPTMPESAPDAPPSTPSGPGGQVTPEPPGDASPGLVWKVPANWSAQGERPMRLATYGIPAAAGDGEGAECAVFYFGPGQGGSVQDNIDRWVGQFDHPSTPARSALHVGGLVVDRVSVTGGYLAPSGPMMQSSGTKADYALLGAIAEGPNGLVFFKLTGPVRTVKASARQFDDLLRSLRPGRTASPS